MSDMPIFSTIKTIWLKDGESLSLNQTIKCRGKEYYLITRFSDYYIDAASTFYIVYGRKYDKSTDIFNGDEVALYAIPLNSVSYFMFVEKE